MNGPENHNLFLMSGIERTLELSAPIAWQIAPQLCRREPTTGKDCSWLHRFWPCLRLMRMAATPDRHADFYRSAFDRVPREIESPRVLVCGAADYSMLALALAAFRGRGIEPALSVIDVCDTPLHLNRWYAGREACKVETRRCSVLEYRAAAFDVICTHSFFGQFSREQRPAMIASWRRLLRPGGLAITTLPLRPGSDEAPNRFTPEQADLFRSVVRAKADELAKCLGVDPAEVLGQGETYLRARYGYAVHTGAEVRDLFESSGFEVLQAGSGTAPTEAGLDAGGPGLRKRNGEYFSVVARRR